MDNTERLGPATWLYHGVAVVVGTSVAGFVCGDLAGDAPVGVQLAAVAMTWSLPLGWAFWMALRAGAPTPGRVEMVGRPVLRVVAGQREDPTDRDRSRAAHPSLATNATTGSSPDRVRVNKASPPAGRRSANNCRCLHLERLVGVVAAAYAEDHLLVLSRTPATGRVRMICQRTGVTWVGAEPWATAAGRTEIRRTAQPARVGGRRRQRRAASRDMLRASPLSRVARPRWPALAPNQPMPPRRIP